MAVPLPDGVSAIDGTPQFIDAGFVLRGHGGDALRVDRPGSHWAFEMTLPMMSPAQADLVIAALLRARSEGLEMEIPLLGRKQGVPGTPVVDGAGQTGTTLLLRGLNPGYACKTGYWLTLTDAGGQKYLHKCVEGGEADGAGDLSILIEPPLWGVFADGASAELARPVVQGFVTEDFSYSLKPGDLVDGLAFRIEEG